MNRIGIALVAATVVLGALVGCHPVTEREARYGVGAVGCAEGYPSLETALECADHLDRAWGVDAGLEGGVR